jgi:hypothetical protein
MSPKDIKLAANELMVGKQVLVQDKEEHWKGIVQRVKDEETLIIRYGILEDREVNIFDIRSV